MKLMHFVVMALNCENFRSPMSILEFVRRQPSHRRKEVLDRIRFAIKACGPPAIFSMAGCGRKSFQLDARMRELQEASASLGLDSVSPYHRGASGHLVPEDNDLFEELRP